MIPAPSDAVCYAVCYIAWLVSMHVHVLVLCECFYRISHSLYCVFSGLQVFAVFTKNVVLVHLILNIALQLVV